MKGELSVKKLSDANFRVHLDKGQCFQCTEKYSRGYRCRVKEYKELTLFIMNEEDEREECVIMEDNGQ